MEGPDWWNVDDYKLYLSQMAKMRMNFIGLHNYPSPLGEPTVWIGPAEDVAEDGSVRRSYPAQYANTAREAWDSRPTKTSDFVGGAAMIFDRDDFGPDTMIGHCPQPKTANGCNETFNRAGRMFREVFSYARSLGIKTCVGTEMPLTIPQEVQDRLRSRQRSEGPRGDPRPI